MWKLLNVLDCGKWFWFSKFNRKVVHAPRLDSKLQLPEFASQRRKINFQINHFKILSTMKTIVNVLFILSFNVISTSNKNQIQGIKGGYNLAAVEFLMGDTENRTNAMPFILGFTGESLFSERMHCKWKLSYTPNKDMNCPR